VNTVEYQQVLGRRVAQERRRHGLSQPELAALVDQPVAWVSQLERGVQAIERLSVLETLAEALELPLSELPLPELPLPELTVDAPADVQGVRAVSRPAAADSLRVALAGSHSLRAMLGDGFGPPLADLRAQTEKVCALTKAERFDDLASMLSDLLPGLEAAVRAAPPGQQPDIYELAAVSYQACSAALAKLGEPMAAWIAADRAMIAAEKAGNLLLAAAAAYRLASVFLDAQQQCLAEETARTALAALSSVADIGDPDALSLCGGLTLLRAVVAARKGHPSAAFGHLSRARQLALQLGCRRADGLPEFGLQYVALHEIAVSVDLGDAGHALRTAASIDLTSLPPARRARVLIDVARAYALRRQVDEATDALVRAENLCPWPVRDCDRAVQVVRQLLAADGPASGQLLALAGRLGALA
jgi:transcriptional regulator with XRE-family HTH domain